jgi:hypothetical protein
LKASNWQLAVSNFGGGGELPTANCQPLAAAKGNASQEVLLLRGWLNSWPLRSIVSQTVSVSSFLLSSWLPLEGSSVNDFPLQNFATTGLICKKPPNLWYEQLL